VNSVIVELIQAGLESKQQKENAFFDVADRFGLAAIRRK
jgi:hypothetical protein